MKSSFCALVLIAYFVLPSALSRAEEFSIPESSQLWTKVYDPPYRVPTEIPKGSDLRKSLFDQLRPKIAALVQGKKILFNGTLKAYRNWAFFNGETVNTAGHPIGLPPNDNSDTAALWLRTRDGWRLVDYRGGHSDVFYTVWPAQYGVSKKLLGFE